MDSLNPKVFYNPFEDRTKNAPYTQEQLDFLYGLVKKGWSAAKIASEYKIDKESIKKRIKENCWICKKNMNIRKSGLTNTELQEIKNKIEQGMSKEKICSEYNISKVALLHHITNNKWEKTKKKQYSFNEHYFDEIANEHQAYWLGFLYADGYILSKRKETKRKNQAQSFGFSISSKDNELFDYFKQDLQSNNPVHYYQRNDGGSYKEESICGRILLTSQHTVDMLKKHGLLENKTFFLKPPQIKKELIPAFIRGYSDGDGSVYITKKGTFGWSIVGTKEILTFIQDFLNTDVKLSQRFPERQNNNYTLGFCGKNRVPALLDIIYKDASIYLQRKYAKYAEMRGINV